MRCLMVSRSRPGVKPARAAGPRWTQVPGARPSASGFFKARIGRYGELSHPLAHNSLNPQHPEAHVHRVGRQSRRGMRGGSNK